MQFYDDDVMGLKLGWTQSFFPIVLLPFTFIFLIFTFPSNEQIRWGIQKWRDIQGKLGVTEERSRTEMGA